MSLELREGSVVAKAMKEASEQVRSKLAEAVKHYFARVERLASEARLQEPHGNVDFDKHAVQMSKCIINFEGQVEQERKKYDEALNTFMRDAREIQAWIQATTAADRFKESSK